MENKDITFVAFTTKYSENVLHDVTIDLDERIYLIESVDKYGKMVEPQKRGRIRRRSLGKYQETLADLDIVSWPVLDESPTKSFPTIIESSVVLYAFDDESEEFYTTGRNNKDLEKLHQATEDLINTTFGTYEYYEEAGEEDEG